MSMLSMSFLVQKNLGEISTGLLLPIGPSVETNVLRLTNEQTTENDVMSLETLNLQPETKYIATSTSRLWL